MLKNMKIGVRLGGAFGIISLLIIFLAIYTMTNLANIGNSIVKLVDDEMPKTVQTNVIVDEVNNISQSIQHMAIVRDPEKVAAEDSKTALFQQVAKKIIEELRKDIVSAEGKAKMEAMITARMAYLPVMQKVRDYCKAGQYDQANALILGEYSAVQDEYKQRVADLIQFQSKNMTNEGHIVLKETQNIRVILLIVAALIIGLSVTIAFFVTRLITKPLQDCIAISQKVAAGQTDLEIRVDSADETGQLLVAMKNMVASIRSLVNDSDLLSQAALEGKLATRVDTSKHQGDFRKIVEGFNCTLDAVVEPVNESAAVLKEMSRGNLQICMTGNYKGDHAAIKDALNSTITALQGYINNISDVLTEMSGGNLDATINQEYTGDFARIKDSLNLIIQSFNEVLGEFNNAADQVSSGSLNVSESSQALSQASSEQASAVEEINASMTQIAAQTKQNAVNAGQANEMALEVKDNAQNGNDQMQAMLKAMSEINESSANISKIIKVIDEIAFQTNILALNAAVEAARAGQHGKGFAVVAEEVRNLAARSANAAKETTALIEGSIHKVEAGTKIANETALALNKIVDGVGKATGLIGEIAVASNEQATGITQVNTGIVQVSQVTQNNTATAEESASASEELSAQAQLLKEMVGRFRFKGQKTTQTLRNGIKQAGPELLRTGRTPENRDSQKARIALNDTEFVKY